MHDVVGLLLRFLKLYSSMHCILDLCMKLFVLLSLSDFSLLSLDLFYSGVEPSVDRVAVVLFGASSFLPVGC